jgi:aminoglycoside phosphotransferase family enzyme
VVSLPVSEHQDVSTVDKRRLACEAEFAVNRRMGSRLHLGVLPVVVHGDGYRLGGDGEPVDWVVEMRRFDQSQQFDELAARGRLTGSLAEETAQRIAEVHAGLDPVLDPCCATDFTQVIESLRATEADGIGRHGLPPGDPALFERLNAEHDRLRPLIERRRAAGRVRRGHGDLHLRNLCLFEGELTLFDALEFDDRMATADVLYDLAFLLMDLRHRSLREQANRAMNRYWDVFGEEESGLALIPLFTALRATVRMAVAAEAGDAGQSDEYRRLAFDLLAPHDARVIAIGGLSGVGKSAVARAVAARLPGPAGARILRTDVLRKSPLAPGPQSAAETPLPARPRPTYSADARRRIYTLLVERAVAAHDAGAVVIADATFQDEDVRAELSGLKRPVSGIWLDAPLEVRLRRIAGRSADPSDADEAVARGQRDPGSLGAGWQRIDAGGSIDDVSRRVVQALQSSA